MFAKKVALFVLSLFFTLGLCLGFGNVNVKTQKARALTRDELIEQGMARAEFMYQYRWKATQNLIGWGYTFTADNYYTVPYSQPYYYGGYLFYNITLTQFEAWAATGENDFYGAHNNNGNTRYCPKYGIDCSAFASFVLGYSQRLTTYNYEVWSTNRANGFYKKSYDDAARGDFLNSNSGEHVHILVIKEVSGDNITTYESTPGYAYGFQDIRVRTRTKAEWASDGYSVVAHDYVTNCGGAPYDDVSGRTSKSLEVRSNNVLGSTKNNAKASSWDLTNAHNTSSANFGERKAVLSSFSGDNALYFNQSNSTYLKVGATFKAIGKLNDELYGKFGIGFFTSNGKGFFAYVDAQGTSGTEASCITGKNVAVVAKNSYDWDWGQSTNYDIATNVYDYLSPITLEINRKGVKFDIYVNGVLAKTLYGLNYSIDPDEKIYPCIISFNTYLEVTDYYSLAQHNSIVIDGDLSDWQSLSTWEEINANKKVANDTQTNKGVTFYTRWTREGLFVYGIAKHFLDSRNASDWWQNTCFEVFVNGNEAFNQYYANNKEARGFDSFYFKTSGRNGNYTSVLEAFIADDDLFDEGLNIGLSFKIRSYTTVNVHDYITLSDGTQTDKWWAENTDPETVPFTLSKEYLREQTTPYTMENPIGDMLVDGDLSDWKSLSNWQEIQSKAIITVDDNDAEKGFWVYTRLTDDGLFVGVEAHHDKNLGVHWGDDWWQNVNLQFYIGLSSYENRVYVTEFLDTGFTYSKLITEGTENNYITVFEGYMSIPALTHFGAYNGKELYIGVGFRVNDGVTTDTITVSGTVQTFWYADNIHPLMANNLILKEVVSPIDPDDESLENSDTSVSYSENSVDTASQNSLSQESADVSSESPAVKKTGCGAKIGGDLSLLMVAFIALAMVKICVNKQKKLKRSSYENYKVKF